MSIGAPDYREYMASDEWRIRRVAALERAIVPGRYFSFPACEVCGKEGYSHKNRAEGRDRRFRVDGSKGLEVHHLHYRNLGFEEPDDLIVLCTDACYYADYDLRYHAWRDRTMKLAGETDEEWSAKREAAGPMPELPKRVGCHERTHDDQDFRREVARIAGERG